MQFLPQRTFWITPRLIPGVTRAQNIIKFLGNSFYGAKTRKLMANI